MKIYCDYYSEIPELFNDYNPEIYYDFKALPTTPGAVYIVGRTQLKDNVEAVRALCRTNTVVFSNPAEGSETLAHHLKLYGVEEMVLNGELLLVTGGELPPNYRALLYDHFLTQPQRYTENITASKRSDEIFEKTEKPWKFLFLNGRNRGHRRDLLNRFKTMDLLRESLWTCLDGSQTPVKRLPEYYEVDLFHEQLKETPPLGFAKYHLFNNRWGEIYIKPEPYIDTYFSVVTETVFYYPHSFRTEKIAKPLMMGHPFIAVANAGFYRDLRNLGFKTFDSIIDESFDSIEDNQARLDRIVAVVADLCKQDMLQFLSAAEPICKYNQQHLLELGEQLRSAFPARFFQYINERSRIQANSLR